MTEDHVIPEVIEGKLLAHRRVLAALVAVALDDRPETRRRLARLMSRDVLAADHDEDPGAMPDSAFAIEASVAEELGLIAKAVAAIRDVGSDEV